MSRYESAFVLGGSSGVGEEVVNKLIASGVKHIGIASRRLESLEAVVHRFYSHNVSIKPYQVDAMDYGSLHTAIQNFNDRAGGIDAMVCSTVPKDVQPEILEHLDGSDLQYILTSIALPPINMTRIAIPLLKQTGGGSIVLVASDAAKVPTPGESIIGAAMAGITMFGKTSALENKRHSIRINTVTPSLIGETETSERMLKGGFSATLFNKAIGRASLGLPTAAEVAELVEFFLSPRSSTITGQSVSINGGISIA